MKDRRKQCSCCRQVKDLTFYYQTRSGYQSKCIRCYNEYQQARRAKKREKDKRGPQPQVKPIPPLAAAWCAFCNVAFRVKWKPTRANQKTRWE